AFDAYDHLALGIDPLRYALHGELGQLVVEAAERVDRLVGRVDGACTGRCVDERAAIRCAETHCGGWDELVTARNLQQVEAETLVLSAALLADDRLDVAVVDLGLLVRELLEGVEGTL